MAFHPITDPSITSLLPPFPLLFFTTFLVFFHSSLTSLRLFHSTILPLPSLLSPSTLPPSVFPLHFILNILNLLSSMTGLLQSEGRYFENLPSAPTNLHSIYRDEVPPPPLPTSGRLQPLEAPHNVVPQQQQQQPPRFDGVPDSIERPKRALVMPSIPRLIVVC